MSDRDKKDLFALFAVATDYDKPLILIDLTFAQLIDEIVFPYESNKPFFIDGVPLKRDKIKKLKIVKQKERFKGNFENMHHKIRDFDIKHSEIIAKQYHIRLEALLRESCIDVTSQVIKAFDTTIKPKLKDYLPNRNKLIQSAISVFIEGIKFINK